jgi:hypothetical protein
VITTRNFGLADEARFAAQMLVSIGDALISVWDSKFYYGRWRPVTVIRLTDDLNWRPLAVTPNHPEYSAAHGAFTGALAEELRQFFGTKDLRRHASEPSARWVAKHCFLPVEQEDAATASQTETARAPLPRTSRGLASEIPYNPRAVTFSDERKTRFDRGRDLWSDV